ncbi:MAG TPA: cyclase family protein [Pyrinomonadaceae bacterium]|jgi:arylformamidase|nr:cyclase family protein [Pyrinomonadaceae bacterium]
MPIYDVTVPVSNELPTWPSDPGVEIVDYRSFAAGDGVNVSMLNLGAHTGTHVDAPAHFIDGAAKVESLPLDALIGDALVIEVPEEIRAIDEKFVQQHYVAGTERVLFKTRNSAFWSEADPQFHTDFTYLDLPAAKWLVEQGIKLVGIDYLSIEKYASEKHETHLALLSHGVVILEGLNLTGIVAGKYELICLPLRLRSNKGDGAPARVVLRTFSG